MVKVITRLPDMLRPTPHADYIEMRRNVVCSCIVTVFMILMVAILTIVGISRTEYEVDCTIDFLYPNDPTCYNLTCRHNAAYIETISCYGEVFNPGRIDACCKYDKCTLRHGYIAHTCLVVQIIVPWTVMSIFFCLPIACCIRCMLFRRRLLTNTELTIPLNTDLHEIDEIPVDVWNIIWSYARNGMACDKCNRNVHEAFASLRYAPNGCKCWIFIEENNDGCYNMPHNGNIQEALVLYALEWIETCVCMYRCRYTITYMPHMYGAYQIYG